MALMAVSCALQRGPGPDYQDGLDFSRMAPEVCEVTRLLIADADDEQTGIRLAQVHWSIEWLAAESQRTGDRADIGRSMRFAAGVVAGCTDDG